MKIGKYFILTYGCQMNVHETEKIGGMLENLGYTATDKKEEADIIVFNTCCIRESAEQKIYGNIGDVKNLKKKNKNLIVVVCGCMSQQEGVANLIRKKYPFVNIVIGTHNVDLLKDYVENFNATKKPLIDVWKSEGEVFENESFKRDGKLNAWVNIMYGCNNFCTYCIVPYVRGRERSRSIKNIKAEVENLVLNQGYKIVTLLGQNVNSYGKDFNDGTNFVTLLKELVRIPAQFKLKFLTSHPKDFSDDLIDLIAKEDKISKAIHLPVQSGSDRILKAMNRVYTLEHYKNLVAKIYDKIPNASLSTDIIVGFPTETEDDFNDTLELVNFCNYSSLFGFIYSKRRGTIAEKMDGQVPIDVKRKRVNLLLDLQKEISAKNALNMLNNTFQIMVENVFEDCFVGRTDGGKTIKVLGKFNFVVGQYCNVKITKITQKQIVGEIV